MESINTNFLRFLDSSDIDITKTDGNEKVVYKAEYGGLILATKFYRSSTDEMEVVDKNLAARKELEAYRTLRKSSLGIYIPEPYDLITNSMEEVVALGIEWREGLSLDRSYPSYKISPEEADLLKKAILNEAENGIFIDLDMLNIYNLNLDPYSKSRLWFGECNLERPNTVKGYIKLVDSLMAVLKHNKEFVWR